jgi:hypothetical protein
MIITRIALLLALLSLLISVYGGSRLMPALLRSGVVFIVGFAVMFVVQITLIYAYRKAKEAELHEAKEQQLEEQTNPQDK